MYNVDNQTSKHFGVTHYTERSHVKTGFNDRVLAYFGCNLELHLAENLLNKIGHANYFSYAPE